MDLPLTPLSQLDAAALDSLTELHQAVMHTLLSDLGQPVVRRYYDICQGDPAVIGLCAVAPDGKIVGWAVGSSHPDELNARLRHPLNWFAGQILRLAFRRPTVLFQLILSVFSASLQMENEQAAVELTYIGVDPSARGQGLGTALLKAFADAGRAAGYRRVVLSVETDNPEAASIYRHCGFQITRTFVEGRFQRHRMQLLL